MSTASHAAGVTEPAVRFGILLYVNRSGSTLLSRLLSEAHADLFVFPELGFPLALLLERRVGRILAGERLLAVIQADPRCDALALGDAELTRICQAGSSADMHALLTAIATAAHGRRPAAILLKLEGLLYFADDLREMLPDVRFIHLLRDPRAVVSSMLQTPVPEKPNSNMARGSLYYAAMHWRRYVGAVAKLAARHPVVEVRYESLHSDAAASCAPVLASFGLEAQAVSESRGSYRIAAIDAAIHALVFDKVQPARSEAWARELSAPQIRAVELLCGPAMARYGYAAMTQPSHGDVTLLRDTRAAHRRAMAAHMRSTAASYVRRGGFKALLRRLALRVAEGAVRARRSPR